MAEYFKQPNGKYCVISWNGVEKYNLTEDDVKQIFVEEAEKNAEETIKNAKNYGCIIERFLKSNISENNSFFEQIGFTEPYAELVKYVPRVPVDKQYSSCNFTTYAKCPNCKHTVQDGIGFKQEKCECGQMLDWESRW